MSSLRYLMNVEGISGRFNNLIYVPCCMKRTDRFVWPIVCYFGGDIQNFHDEMIKQNNHEFLSYSLENVAKKLSNRFNEHDIFIVQPSKMINSFSFKQINITIDSSIEACLIAFSKGQIVINQLARSLHQVSPQSKFKLTDLYLLDGGHNGSKDFWIIQSKFIDSLVKHGCQKFHIGVTDFQLNKPQNIRQEFEKFHKILLTMANVNVEKTYLAQNDFAHLSPINLHFKLLDYLFENLL
ncbi:hypothetical protein HUG17_10370 [Dermatophagoides farinae]|uniref:Uncharacterized protein n=1 Tax=Dermatophagoides farinae TaxID=6954 RepID=A0A9D4SCU3_DERFA|nr:hypothetical protein HUG17_10370 [Dermatophagoides farinae]